MRELTCLSRAGVKRPIQRLYFLFLSFILTLSLFGQNTTTSYSIKYITDKIYLDGIIDEAIWQTADIMDNFWQFFPSDSVRAKSATVVKMLYDDENIYIGIQASTVGKNHVVSSLRRDFSAYGNDNVSFMFDTYKDGNNAFLFGVTPYGVERESLISGGGRSLNTSWDVKWQAESRMNDDGFVVEILIPLISVKFREGETEWRMQCYRWDFQGNEQSAWARVPQNQQLSNLAFMGILKFERPLSKARTPVALIPYINTYANKDYLTENTERQLHAGGDAKIAIGNNMNLDLTINPDFSNVETDYIQTNLTRFELFLPEKRQFFIDNSDLFANFGSSREASPFFSRRIGLARDTTGNSIENQIMGGVRLSGKLNENWRLGFLNMQTSEDPGNKIPSNNNMMFVIQRKVFSRSNIGVFLVNRESFKDYEFVDGTDMYNRVAGIDFNFASADSKWTGKTYIHKSFQPYDNNGNISGQLTTTHNARHLGLTTNWVYVDNDFRADLGFLPRRGFLKTENSIDFKFYPRNSRINNYSISPEISLYWKPDSSYKVTDRDYSVEWTAFFKNQSSVTISLSNQYVFLWRGFDPTRTPGGIPLSGNAGYTFNQANISYNSSYSNPFTYSVTSTLGEFYTGNIYSLSGSVSMKFQPWVLLSMTLSYNGIRLPDPHPSADIWLLSPSADVTFSKTVFWSSLVQYSSQRESLGINSRLQWRFAPLSDLYLVYNDNYVTSDFSPTFRSINLKITYWLNI